MPQALKCANCGRKHPKLVCHEGKWYCPGACRVKAARSNFDTAEAQLNASVDIIRDARGLEGPPPKTPKKLTRAEKIIIYEDVLNRIAVWDDGDDPNGWDEKYAAIKARVALKKAGVAPAGRKPA
jgi:hypothetical protein